MATIHHQPEHRWTHHFTELFLPKMSGTVFHQAFEVFQAIFRSFSTTGLGMVQLNLGYSFSPRPRRMFHHWWMFHPYMGVPNYGWFTMENPMKIRMIWGYPYFRKPSNWSRKYRFSPGSSHGTCVSSNKKYLRTSREVSRSQTWCDRSGTLRTWKLLSSGCAGECLDADSVVA